jgi:tRNA dimethylallyltransferase
VEGKRRSQRPLVVTLYGPTSAGKTELSLRFADALRKAHGIEVEIVSADSRQVYRYMDIGTSKVTSAQRSLVPHHMLDVQEPVRKLSLREYQRGAFQAINGVVARGSLALVVGGTGTYVQPLAEDWVVEDVDRTVERLGKDFPPSATADALAVLRKADPAFARSVDRRNRELILRRLASVMAGSQGAPQRMTGGRYRWRNLGLLPPQRTLDFRIAATLDSQFKRGLYEEVLALERRYGLCGQLRRLGKDSRNQVLHTHGYREFFEMAGRMRRPVDRLRSDQLDMVRAEAFEHIRAYSLRQRSWFEKMDAITVVRNEREVLRAVLAASDSRP